MPMLRRPTLKSAFGATALVAGLLTAGVATAGPLRDAIQARIADRMKERGAAAADTMLAGIPGARKTTFSYGADPAQSLDVYTASGVGKAPIIVMVHGGAWRTGDRGNAGVVVNKAAHFLPKGFVLVSVGYRLLPQAMAYEQAEDVAAAMRWIAANADRFGGDGRKIVLMGHSAGAHLVALLSVKPAMVGRPWAGTVVLDTAVIDVAAKMRDRHLPFYDAAFGADPAYWAKASPAAAWTPAAVPMMLVCSTERRDRPCDEAAAFRAKTAAAGRDTPVLPQALSHAEINANLGLPGAYTDAVDRFIATRLAAAP